MFTSMTPARRFNLGWTLRRHGLGSGYCAATRRRTCGVSYSHDGYQSAAPYAVVNAEHWVFEGAGLGSGDLFGFESLHMRCPGGTSGHGLDKVGRDTPANMQLLARGTNPQGSGAALAVYETDSGAAVFSVGSLCWPLSLLIDPGTSAVTRTSCALPGPTGRCVVVSSRVTLGCDQRIGGVTRGFLDGG